MQGIIHSMFSIQAQTTYSQGVFPPGEECGLRSNLQTIKTSKEKLNFDVRTVCRQPSSNRKIIGTSLEYHLDAITK